MANNAVVKYDETLARKLHLSAEQVTELIEGGITLEEYAQAIGVAIQQDADNVIAKPARWKIVPSAQAFKNDLTDEIKQELIGTIVFAHISRGLFLTSDNRPDCFSNDGKTGTYTENDEVKHRHCEGCPFNVYGTGKEGKGKACKEQRRLFLLEEEKEMPSVINLPPTSLNIWDRFVAGLLQKGKSTAHVKVRLALDSKKEGSNEWSTLKVPTILKEYTPLEFMKINKMRDALAASQSKNEFTAETPEDQGYSEAGTAAIGAGASPFANQADEDEDI